MKLMGWQVFAYRVNASGERQSHGIMSFRTMRLLRSAPMTLSELVLRIHQDPLRFQLYCEVLDMPYHQYRFSFGSGLSPVIKNLMIIMGAVFLVERLIDGFIVLTTLPLSPSWCGRNISSGNWALIFFLHGGLTHLLFNLLGLWMFGGELENYWGSKKFLRYFLFCGIGAGICTVLFTPYLYQRIPVVGASGAIYGILLAFGWLFPNRLIYIYFLFPIPAKYMVDPLRSYRTFPPRWREAEAASLMSRIWRFVFRSPLYGCADDPAENPPRILQTEVVTTRPRKQERL